MREGLLSMERDSGVLILPKAPAMNLRVPENTV